MSTIASPMRRRPSEPQGAQPHHESAEAVRQAWATATAGDSSLGDRLAAAKVLLFLTFEDPSSSKVAWWTSLVLILAILVNCGAFVFGSLRKSMYQPAECPQPVCVPGPDTFCEEPVCHPVEKPAFEAVELWTIAIFTVDYLIRLLTVHGVPTDLINPRRFEVTVDGRIKDRSTRKKERHGLIKTLLYMVQWLNIIDVVSILPFYIHLALKASEMADLGVLRVLRLLRVVRIFKLGRYSEGGMLLGRTLRASLPALVLFVFLITILTIVFGSLIYFVEMGTFKVTRSNPHGAFYRPNARGTALEISPFSSILMGIYWTIVNTTTVSNAALYPTTTAGRFLSCVVAYTGLASIALPISIVGKNFTEQYNLIYGSAGGAFEEETEKPVAPLSITAGIDKKPAPSHEPYSSLGGSTDGYPSKGVAAVAVDMEGQYPPLVVRELQAQLQALRVEVADLKARVPQLQGAEM